MATTRDRGMTAATCDPLASLVHTVTVYRSTGIDSRGRPQWESEGVAGIPCFISTNRARHLAITEEARVVRWSVLFAADATIGEADKLESGVDETGREVLPLGVVTEIDPLAPPGFGLIGYQARVQKLAPAA